MEILRESEREAIEYLTVAMDTVERLTDNGAKSIDVNDIHDALRPWGTSRINRVLSTLERSGHIHYRCNESQHHLAGWILTP